MDDSIYRFLFLGIGIILVLMGVKSFYSNEAQFREFYQQVDYTHDDSFVGSASDWVNKEVKIWPVDEEKGAYSYKEIQEYLIGLSMTLDSPNIEIEIIYNLVTYRPSMIETLLLELNSDEVYIMSIETSKEIKTILISY